MLNLIVSINILIPMLEKQDLYACGARRIGVTSLPPLGCIPVTRTILHESGCVSRINSDAQGFNEKLNSSAIQLQQQLSGLKIVVFDIYKPLYELIQDPSKQGTNKFVFRNLCYDGLIRFNIIISAVIC